MISTPSNRPHQSSEPLPLQHSTRLIKDASKRSEAQCSFSSGQNPHIMNEPVQLFCGHQVCKFCLEKRLIEDKQFLCPAIVFTTEPKPGICGQLIDRERQAYVDVAEDRKCKSLVVSCAFAQQGCSWQDTYEHYSAHHVLECGTGKSQFLAAAVEGMKGLLATRTQFINALADENNQLRIQSVESQKTVGLLNDEVVQRDQQLELLAAENSQLSSKDVESQKVIAQLNDTVAERDRQLTELKKELKDSKAQIKSSEEIVRLLNSERQPPHQGRSDRQAPTASASPSVTEKTLSTAQTLACLRQLRQTNTLTPEKQPSTAATGKAATVQTGACAGVHTQTFLIKDDEIFSTKFGRVSRTFELDGIKAEFMFGKFSKYAPIGLFYRLHGATSDSVRWPCTKTMIFNVHNFSHSGKKDDLQRMVHFPRTPARCKDKPGGKPNVSVGFREFCEESVLQYQMDRRKPSYFDNHGNCQVTVTVRDTKPGELSGPAYEFDYRSVGLYWAIRTFRSKAESSKDSEFCCKSPHFLTVENGCRLSLRMDTRGTNSPGQQSVTIAAVLEESQPGPFAWPLKGTVFVRLVDHNEKTNDHIDVFIPVTFDKPNPSSIWGPARKVSSEVSFFKKRFINLPVAPDQPQYLAHGEIVVEASFIPD